MALPTREISGRRRPLGAPSPSCILIVVSGTNDWMPARWSYFAASFPQVVQERPLSQPTIIKIRRPLSFFPIDVSKPPLPASNSVKFAVVVGMRGRLDAKLQVYVGAAGRCPLAPGQQGRP